MSDDIGFGSSQPAAPSARRVVPLKIGDAVVYIEQAGVQPQIESSDAIRPVAPTQQEAFEEASAIIDQCVSTIGHKIDSLAAAVKPQKVTVEFSISFEATGKAQIIPLLVTGETKVNTGLKVTATWESSTTSGNA